MKCRDLYKNFKKLIKYLSKDLKTKIENSNTIWLLQTIVKAHWDLKTKVIHLLVRTKNKVNKLMNYKATMNKIH